MKNILNRLLPMLCFMGVLISSGFNTNCTDGDLKVSGASDDGDATVVVSDGGDDVVDPYGDDTGTDGGEATPCATDVYCTHDTNGVYVYASGCGAIDSTDVDHPWKYPLMTLDDALNSDTGGKTIYIAGAYGEAELNNQSNRHVVGCEGASISQLVISGGSDDITVEDFNITATLDGSSGSFTGAIEVLSSGSSSGAIDLNNLSLRNNTADYGVYILNSQNVSINGLDTIDESAPSDGAFHSFVEIQNGSDIEIDNITYDDSSYDIGIFVQDADNINIGSAGTCSIMGAGIAQIIFADTQSSSVSECTLQGDNLGANLYAYNSEVDIQTLSSSANKAGVVACSDTGSSVTNYTMNMTGSSTITGSSAYDMIVGSIELIGSADIGSLWIPSDQGGSVSGFSNTDSAPTTSMTANTRTTFCDLTDILSTI